MFAEGIFPIGDGLLDIDEERLKGLLVPHDINEIYDVEQTPFARGKFAAVRRAVHKNSGTHYAAKFLKRRRRAQSSDKEIKHEIAVLMLCNEADNIVKLSAVHESRSDTALLLELATGGELQTFLDNEECLTEANARICLREVLKALQFLHKRSIVHLDLKPQNILLAGECIEDGLKLCDFGISRVVADGTNVREIVGTPDYVAPEVLQYEPLSLCTDIWSVGVLAYVLLSGFSPFGGDTKQETFLNISQCALTFPDKLFGGVSTAAIDFIRRALRIKPNDRMTAAGCLEHIWLKDECSIDRHIFNTMETKQQLEEDEDHDHNQHKNDDCFNSQENGQRETKENVQINTNDEIQIATDTPQAVNPGSSEEKISSLRNSHTKLIRKNTKSHINGHTTAFSDGHRNGYENFYTSGLSIDHRTNEFLNARCSVLMKFKKLCDDIPHNKSIKLSSIKHDNATTTRIIAVHNIPATKSVTVPLCNVQSTTSIQQKQQTPLQRHMQARRHSSDSNKENTFLTTKLIAANNSNGTLANLKKSSSPSLTTTINQSVIATDITATASLNAGSIVPTVVLTSTTNAVNGATDNMSFSNATQSLFPDAPTTPKVIRKTPITDALSTSVKALVKKFQVEGGEQSTAQPEFATNGSKSQYEQQQANARPTHNTSKLKLHANGIRSSVSPPASAHTSAITITCSARRSSEPITAVHTYKKQNTTVSTATVPTSTTQKYKSSCVYCVSCTNILTNGCEHPNSSINNVSNCLAATAVNTPTTTVIKSSCNSTKPILSKGSLTSSSNSSIAATSSKTTALLFGQQQQHSSHRSHDPPHSHHLHPSHHHLHHRSATKNDVDSRNGLSLDQGIIC